jgi:transposase
MICLGKSWLSFRHAMREGMMSQLFWSSEEAWAAIEPFMPSNQSGARRMDGRPVISNIFHVLKSGCPMVRLP